MNLKIINYCYYTNRSNTERYNAPILVFICRGKDLKRYLVFICDKEFLAPEFYVEKKEWEELNDGHILFPEIVGVFDAPNSNYGEETVKLTTTFPWEVGRIKKRFNHTYLADVKWEKMCIEKMGLRTSYIEVPDNFQVNWVKAEDIKPLPEEEHFYCPIRWIAWDIETNMEPVFPVFNGWIDAEKCEVICNSGYDSYTKEYHRFFWHPRLTHKPGLTFWERKGSYYVPALKGYKEYDNDHRIIDHGYDNEVDMLKAYIDWYSKSQPDCQYGFNSEGGYRIHSRKGYSRKRWFDGYDMPFFTKRCMVLGLGDYMQRMSPLPNIVKGVRLRRNGGNVNVVIDGVCQLDFIYTNEIFMYHKKYNDFRGGNLQSYMSYFLGFGKVPHREQVFEMWRDNISSDYNPSNPEEVGVKKQKNLVKELYEQAKSK